MILQKINAGVFNEMVQDETGTFVMNKNQPSHLSSEIDSDTVKKIRELSKLRKSIELDLKAIATATKISTNQLKNIESFKFEKLPPNPMRLSFIDQYCSVIEKANNTPYGLSAGVWTDKGSKVFNLTSKLNAGVIWANTYNKFDPTSPFGGYKESGHGREGGLHGLFPYLNLSYD